MDDHVAEWRRCVDDLCRRSEEDALPREVDDISSLRWLMRREETLPRMELKTIGDRPYLFTAPHCINLRRDGCTPHAVEMHTAEVATGLAKILQGACLRWTEAEQRRSELLGRLARRWRKGEDDTSQLERVLDPRNRDPNYLTTSELLQNQWFQAMCSFASRQGVATMLHVDVHGCRDPPDSAAHLVVGLGAMQATAASSAELDVLIAFKEALLTELTDALGRLSSKLRAAMDEQEYPLVTVVLPNGSDSEQFRFAGRCKQRDRRTQTQQAVEYAGFSHAVQLEFSRTLRQLLHKGHHHGASADLTSLANALRSAWVSVKARQAAAPGAAVEVQDMPCN